MELSLLILPSGTEDNLIQIISQLSEILPSLLSPDNYEVIVLRYSAKALELTGGLSQPTINNLKVISHGSNFGTALIEGMKACQGRYLMTIDPDFPENANTLLILYAYREQADIVIASRYIKSGYNQSSFFRRSFSRLLTKMYQIGLNLSFRDMFSGFRLYNRKIFNEIHLTLPNYGILQEILMKGYALGYHIQEVPFHYKPSPDYSSLFHLLAFGKDYIFNFYRFWKLRNSIHCGDYDERAFNSRIWLQRYWQRRRYSIILEYSHDQRRILDVGCGSSHILDGLPQSIGCDVQLNKLRYKRSPFRHLLQASVFHLPFKSNYFQTVIFSQVIEHLPEDKQILDEVVRVTQKDGYIIVGTPDYATHWKIIEKLYKIFQPSGYADEHITHYTREKLLQEMNQRNCLYCDHKYILGAELIMKFQKQ